ncbi:MAG: GMC family oxidoreductase [Polyangiaceae bacterium]|nr:GMC family oxidoreductase [Polyangiaceae bacterium]
MTGEHITFTGFGEPAVHLTVDFVVVGSGAGGASAAVILARAGYSVAIVEAGPWRAPEDYPSTTYGAMRDLFSDWGALVTQSRALWPIVQASCVGGTTVVNSAIIVRTPGDCFDRWTREYGIDGESLSRRVWEHQDRLESELTAQVVPPDARGYSNVLAMDAAEKLGWQSHYMVRSVTNCEGTGQCLQGCKKGRKQSTNLNYVPEVLQRGGVVMSCAKVERITSTGNTATGVTGHLVDPVSRKKGSPFFVRAKRAVMVAASATQTPILLAKSGFKSKPLGTLFRAHPGTGIFGVYDNPVDQNVGATQGWASTAFRVDPGFKLETLAIPPEMVAGRLPGGGRELVRRFREYRHIAMWVAAVRAESAGTVKPGLFGNTVVRYQLDEPDMRRFRSGLAMVAKAHFAAGAREIIPGIFGLPYKLNSDQISLIENGPLDPRCYIAILSHLFGGCPMSRDPSLGVVDEHGKVHGVDGLYVADAAAIPTTIGVNPQHTIMGLAAAWAERLADA